MTVYATFAALFLLFSALTAAQAACSGPAGVAGSIIYNGDWHVPQYCNDTSWVAMGKALSVGCNAAITTISTTYGKDVCGDGTYIYMTSLTSGVKAFTFNGATLTQVGSIASTNANSIWCGGGNIIVGDAVGGVRAYTFNGTTFTLKATYQPGSSYWYEVWGDGTYIYASEANPVGPDNKIHAFTLGASSFTLRGSIDVDGAGGDQTNALWGDGTYIYQSEYLGGINAYTFNGSTFAVAGSQSSGSNAQGIGGDGNYIYLADLGSNSIRVFSFDGSAFTQLTSVSTSNPWDVWADGEYVYLADGTGGIRTYTFNGTTLTQVGQVSTSPYQSLGVWGDGTYVYLAGGNSNELKVFNEGGCSCSNGGKEGTIMYNADRRVMQYCNGTGWQPMGKTIPIKWGMNFTGSTYLARGAALTGDADVKTGTVSFWFRRGSTTGTLQRIFQSEGDRFSVYLGTDNRIYVKGMSGGGAGTVQLLMNGSTVITDTNWHHVVLSFDLNNNTATGRYMYLDNVAETLTVTTYLNAVIDYTRTQHVVGGSATALGTELFTGDLAEFYMNRSFMDLSASMARQQFRNADGTPADLGASCVTPTGAIPIVCLSDKSATTWITNKGSGGGFTKTGALFSSGGNLPGLSCSHSLTQRGSAVGIAGSFDDVWGDGTYIYLADDIFSGSLRAYTFDGASLTLRGSTPSTYARGVWSDGTYIYLSEFSNGMKAYTFNGTTFTEVGWTGAAGNNVAVWGDGTYIYNATLGELKAYTFNGSTFTLAGSTAAGSSIDVWGDGTYIYLADYNGTLRAYTFNGSAFTAAGSIATTAASGVWGDGTYIYLADNGGGLKAYTYNGATFTLVGSVATPSAQNVWGDGTYIYLADSTVGLITFSFDGTTFTQVGGIVSGSATDVWGDGKYIYRPTTAGNLAAFDFASGLCSCSSGGGITRIDRDTSAIGGWKPMAAGTFKAGGYIFAADHNQGGVRAYTFNGTTLTLVGSVSSPNFWQNDVWSDGTYVYVAQNGSSTNIDLTVYSFNGTTFTLKDSDIYFASPTHIWVQGGYIYTAGSGGVLQIYSFSDPTLTYLDGITGPTYGIWGDGTYLYVTTGTQLRAYTYDGVTDTLRGSIASTTAVDVWGDGTYIYTANGTSGVRAYTFSGTGGANGTFTEVGNISGTARSIGGGGGTIFTMQGNTSTFSAGMAAYTFNGSTFTQIGSSTETGNGVWGDGSYFYVGRHNTDANGSVAAYAVAGGLSSGGEGTMRYNKDFNKLEYCNGTGWSQIGK